MLKRRPPIEGRGSKKPAPFRPLDEAVVLSVLQGLHSATGFEPAFPHGSNLGMAEAGVKAVLPGCLCRFGRRARNARHASQPAGAHRRRRCRAESREGARCLNVRSANQRRRK
jgi:hypothetical protein